ncbi:MAG: phosphate signaling complex protein PhoU [Erysipelotrichia bacterium]|nr:phosphate signaling complex protein PhoU [Erysipelotrichia bacterium]NCC54197.1 phosphate signaling complex protein PhoU [Erysipelotrichia bacterium]
MNLDKTLEVLETSVVHMAQRVIKQHEKCLEILESKDRETALTIIKEDEFINRYEEDINHQAMEQFALLNPVATDLRRVLVAIKIASELERIGDYAKGLASFIIKQRDPEEDELLILASKMEKYFIEMIKEALRAYTKRSVETAFEVAEKDQKIDEMYKVFKEKLQESSSISIKQAFYLSGLIRNIERSGDHTINICEHIVYLIKGVQYDFD